MTTAFLIASGASLAWIACVWSGNGVLNVMIKTWFAALTFVASILIGKVL